MKAVLKKLAVRIILAVGKYRLKLRDDYQVRTYGFYPLQILTAAEKDRLEKRGADLRCVEMFRESNPVGGPRGLPRYQEEVIATGQFESVCVLCGKHSVCHSSHPVSMDGFDLPIFYEFDCCTSFFLIAAKSPARIIAVYYPRKRLIVSLENYRDHPHNLDYYGLKTFLTWISALKRLRDQPGPGDHVPISAALKPIVLAGFVGNFGHHLTDEIDGLSRLSAEEKARMNVLLGPYDWFGFRKIFDSEIEVDETCKAKSIDLTDRVFSRTSRTGSCVIRVTSDLPLGSAISERIIRVATDQLSSDKQRLLSEIEGSPVIWVTLRSHVRYWVDQVEGLPKVLNALSVRYPRLAVVFDGFTGEFESFELIKDRLSSDIRVFSAMGFNIMDTLPFARACDFFIAPLGAGVVITSIPNMPGIVHTHSEWAKKDRFVPSRREDGVQCQAISGKIVSGTDVFDYNYQISTKALLDGTVALATSLGFEPRDDQSHPSPSTG